MKFDQMEMEMRYGRDEVEVKRKRGWDEFKVNLELSEGEMMSR